MFYSYYLSLVLILWFLQTTNSCFPTASVGGAPEIPINPCTTCTLPLLAAPEGDGLENAMGSQTTSTVGPGCIVFDVTCQATMGDPDIAFGGLNDGMNIVVSGPTKGPLTRQFVCNEEGIVIGADETGTQVEFDSVYCSQVA